jgi:HSP20 family molecular chaperone IbpA
MFQRTVNINIPVDSGKAEAKYEDGLLILTVPKAEASRPKTIQVVSK